MGALCWRNGDLESRAAIFYKSQPRTGHTREPDPTHNELTHTITRKTATHERNPDMNQSVSQLFHGPTPRSPLHPKPAPPLPFNHMYRVLAPGARGLLTCRKCEAMGRHH